MYRFLENLDITKSGKFFKIFLAPIWLLLEYICYQKYWKNIILLEFITNDKLFEFLDNNEFGYKKGRFVKKDLIDDNEYLSGRKLDDCKHIIKREFIETLTDLINTECTTNIEDYISLIVSTDIKISKVDDEVFQAKIYEVYIQFCRYWWLQKAIQYSIVWLLIFSLIIISAYIGLILWI